MCSRLSRLTVQGSHGEFVVDHLGRRLDLDNPERPYPEVARVDINEYLITYGEIGQREAEDADILDVGIWLDTGAYDPPSADHRATIASEDGCIPL